MIRNSQGLELAYPDSKVHGANMGPTWVLSAQVEPHVGPMYIAIWVGMYNMKAQGTCFNVKSIQIMIMFLYHPFRTNIISFP